MSRNNGNPLPTHRFLFIDNFTTKFAKFIMYVFLLFVIAMIAILYAVDRDCTNPDRRNFSLAGKFWIDTNIGSTKEGCTQSENKYNERIK